MVPNPEVAAYPVLTIGAATLTFSCRARQTQGTGSFSISSPVVFVDLVISFPSGRDDVQTLQALRQICAQHLLNNSAFTSWWAPESGTIEQNIRVALDNCSVDASVATKAWGLMFDGQFGPVLAA